MATKVEKIRTELRSTITSVALQPTAKEILDAEALRKGYVYGGKPSMSRYLQELAVEIAEREDAS